MKKYNFDLILTDEEMANNRKRIIQEDLIKKEKQNEKKIMIVAIIGLIIITLFIIHEKEFETDDLSKCENGTITIMTARQYDNQLETFCK